MQLLYRLFIRHPWFFVYGFIKSFFLKRKPMTEPIDFVVTWVDGSDPAWLAEKRKYEQTDKNDDSDKDNGVERYRDWDLFRYWFRAVEKFAPWVNKVYLVTWGHVPEWINRDNPKLVIVNHRDFIPDYGLPTFNCNPIEDNLFRIKGLSEHFVNFNDDLFLTQPVEPEDFFQDGKPLVCSQANCLINTPTNEAFNHMLFSMLGVINAYDWKKIMERHPEKWFFHGYGYRLLHSWYTYSQGKLLGLYYTHMPQAFRRSTCEKAWTRYGKELEETTRHKFRTPLDMTHYLFTLQELADGDFVPMPRYYYGQYYGDGFVQMTDDVETFASYIRQQRFKAICVNDSSAVTAQNYEHIRHTVDAALQSLLPEMSSYESA